jgi:hypothetical protein
LSILVKTDFVPMPPSLTSEEAMWLRNLAEHPTDALPTAIAERLLELELLSGLPVPGGIEISNEGMRWLTRYDRSGSGREG